MSSEVDEVEPSSQIEIQSPEQADNPEAFAKALGAEREKISESVRGDDNFTKRAEDMADQCSPAEIREKLESLGDPDVKEAAYQDAVLGEHPEWSPDERADAIESAKNDWEGDVAAREVYGMALEQGDDADMPTTSLGEASEDPGSSDAVGVAEDESPDAPEKRGGGLKDILGPASNGGKGLDGASDPEDGEVPPPVIPKPDGDVDPSPDRGRSIGDGDAGYGTRETANHEHVRGESGDSGHIDTPQQDEEEQPQDVDEEEQKKVETPPPPDKPQDENDEQDDVKAKDMSAFDLMAAMRHANRGR